MEKNKSVIIKMRELNGQITLLFWYADFHTNFSFWEISREVCVCWSQVCVYIYICLEVHRSGGQRSILGVIPQKQLTLFLDRISYNETWGPSIKLDWLVIKPLVFGYQLPSIRLLGLHLHIWLYMWMLETEHACACAASTLLSGVSLRPPERNS